MLNIPKELRDKINTLVKEYGMDQVKEVIREDDILDGLDQLFGGQPTRRDWYYNNPDPKKDNKEDNTPTPLNKDDHEPPTPPPISIKNDKRKKIEIIS